MKLHIVGSSGTFPGQGRPAAGYLVEQGDTRIWCDAGPGTFMSLPLDSDLIDAVVISHRHPDHCSDLSAAYHAWSYSPQPRSGVPLMAPQSVWDHFCAFIGSDPGCFDFVPVRGGDEAQIGEIAIEFADADHSVPAVGCRFEAGGKVLYYTGDTGPGGDWLNSAEGADLMLCEASYQEATKDVDYPKHLSAMEAGQLARDAGVKRLCITHIPPYLDPAVSVKEAEVTFGRPVALAVPGASLRV